MAYNIAKWNGNVWSALGSGMTNQIGDSAYVMALAVSGTNLYAGGHFNSPGNNIAKWGGGTWTALGSGLSGDQSWKPRVYALAASGTNLYVGGWFTTAGGAPITNIAKWNGSSWSGLGSGFNFNYIAVYSLAVSGTNLYVGGSFNSVGGVAATNIAKWDGHAWSALGTGMSGSVYALAVNGTDLYAGGYFTNAGGVPANNIAKWDGHTWSALGSGVDNTVYALATDGVGHLFAGGRFGLAGTNVSPYIAQANLDHPPVAGTPFIKVIGDEVSEIPARRFVIWCSDPDNDPLSLTAVMSPSAMGALITLETNVVSYAPPPGFLGDDTFGYTITDGNGGFASGTASILVEPRTLAAATMLPPMTSPGALQVNFIGFADLGYTVERAESLEGPWAAIGNVITDDDGVARFTDRNPPAGNAFYRVVH